jgi:DNA-binding LacI/PurR family transcriptional regulator
MTDAPARPPTIRTVAERAGVSKSLVSLVLRGSPHVSPSKREAVQAAITELGFRPNAIARTLTERRTRLVGVLLNDLRNPWFVESLQSITAVLHDRGLRTLFTDGRLDRTVEDAALQGLVELRVDGLVLLGTTVATPALADAAARVPTVVAASRDVELPAVDVVANDDSVGARLAVEHLVGLGHRRIAHLAGSTGAYARLRKAAYVDAMRSAGLAEFVRAESCDATEEGGYRAAVRVLSGVDGDRPSAIFAVNDIAAVGAMSAALELGVSLPHDLSLVGYDNTSLAQIRHLSLTTVDNAGPEVGRRAARALLRRITEPDTEATVELLTPTLRIRGSTAPPPSASAP